VTTDLMTRARAGDGDAFRELTEPHRWELQVHCYRMLGSFQDAEDALQDTLLAAWQGLGGFEGRASIRTWLYRIATHQCLNALRSASRRPAKEWNVPYVEAPEPTGLGEVVWLEPYPDALLQGAIDVPLGPEARYEQTEAISLAFVTALQILPARQRAVLILREVLGYRANEVADLLDSTVESVNSALKRARATLRRRLPPTGRGAPPPAPDSPAERAIAPSSPTPTSPAMSTPWSLYSQTTSSSPCHQFPSNTKAATPWPVSSPASSATERMTWCRRGQMVSRPSEPTFACPPAASAKGPASTY
jgi:RNA polymerase sigma factor (sigma-70 family)